MSITGQAISTLGQPAALSARFQASGCRGLAFKPTLTASTQGNASRVNGASLTVKVAQRPGEANIHKVLLQIPRVLPSTPEHPAEGVHREAVRSKPRGLPRALHHRPRCCAHPILPVPLEGPVYFVSYGGAAFPDAVIVLDGYGVSIELRGETFINGKTGVTTTTFKTVPDAPFTSFELTLPEGPYSALAANLPAKDHYSLCGQQQLTLPTDITAQNGIEIHQNTPISVTGCPKTKTKAQKLAAALKACHKKPKGAKRSGC